MLKALALVAALLTPSIALAQDQGTQTGPGIRQSPACGDFSDKLCPPGTLTPGGVIPDHLKPDLGGPGSDFPPNIGDSTVRRKPQKWRIYQFPGIRRPHRDPDTLATFDPADAARQCAESARRAGVFQYAVGVTDPEGEFTVNCKFNRRLP